MKTSKNLNWILLGIGAVAFLFSSGRWNVPIMAWIWPFCMLYFIRRSQRRYAVLVPCALTFLLSAVKWYGSAGGTAVENIAAGLAVGLIPCAPFLLDWFFARKSDRFITTLIFPLSFAVVEFVMQLTPAATIGAISATQTGNDPLIQLASVFGSYGVSIFVTWFASVLVFVIEVRREMPEKAMRAAVLYLAVFLAAFAFGGIRLAFSDFTVPNVKVAMTTGPYTGDFLSDSFRDVSYEENEASMKGSVETAAAGKADILLFCEEAFNIPDKQEAALVEAAANAARENNIFVLIGLEVDDEDGNQNGMVENVEYMIDNHGEVVWRYTKSHLTNFVEPGAVSQGDGIVPNRLVTLPSGKQAKLASVICMDSDFPTYVRDGLDNDTGIFLVPTWDLATIRAFHTKWVEFRSVENGVSFVRSCMDGVSIATDPYGRVIMHSDTAGSGYETVVFAEVPSEAVFCVYKLIGPVIDWVYVGGLAALIVLSVIQKKRKDD